MTKFLHEMNTIRNRFAHRLVYSFSFQMIPYMDKENSKEWYGIKGIIQEVFQNTAQDLSFIMEENGGEFQFG